MYDFYQAPPTVTFKLQQKLTPGSCCVREPSALAADPLRMSSWSMQLDQLCRLAACPALYGSGVNARVVQSVLFLFFFKNHLFVLSDSILHSLTAVPQTAAIQLTITTDYPAHNIRSLPDRLKLA